MKTLIKGVLSSEFGWKQLTVVELGKESKIRIAEGRERDATDDLAIRLQSVY